TDFAPGAGRYDTPASAAVGYPAFGTLDGHSLQLFSPASGMFRSIDAAAPEYQGGQDFIGGWDPQSGQFLTGYPSPVNDLQFLTGPAVGDVLAGACFPSARHPGSPDRAAHASSGCQQVLGGTSSLDLEAFG